MRDSRVIRNNVSAVGALERSTLILQDSTIADNTVVLRGPPSDATMASGITATDDATVMLVNSIVSGNSKAFTDNTSAFAFTNDYRVKNGVAGVLVEKQAKMRIGNGSRVVDNLSGGSRAGGLVMGSYDDQGRKQPAKLLIDSSVFARNEAIFEGGGVCATHGANLTVIGGSDISFNSCGFSGCGVMVRNSIAAFRGQITLKNNSRLPHWRCKGACVSMVVSEFSQLDRRGRHDMGGGGIAVAGPDASLSLDGPILIKHNVGNGAGGGVYGFGPGVNISICGGVTFTYNEAKGDLSDLATALFGRSRVDLGEDVFLDTLEDDNWVEPLTSCSGSVAFDNDPSACPSGTYRPWSGGCQCCSPGTYSYGREGMRNREAKCLECPDNAVCEANVVRAVEGHWQSTTKSAQIHRCPMFNTSCAGTPSLDMVRLNASVCRQGYTGNLCGSCVEGWGMTVPFMCRQCLTAPLQLALYLLMFFTTAGLVWYTVHATWADNKRRNKDVRVSDLVKVPVQFLQYLVILGSVSGPSGQWPHFLGAWFVASSAVFGAASGQLSLDCWLKQHFTSAGSRLHAAVQRQLVFYLAPIAVLAVVVLLSVLSYAIRRLWLACVAGRQQHRQSAHASPRLHFVSRVRVIALVLLFFAYPTLVQASLSWFACMRIDVEGRDYPQYSPLAHVLGYWVWDIQQECFTGWHKYWAWGLGFPSALLLCVGVPVGIFLFMWSNTHKAAVGKDPEFQEHYGFLYRNFREGVYWWEAVWALQTVLLTGVAVFHHIIGSYHALLLMCLFLALSVAAQLRKMPCAEPLLHKLHLAATCCLIFSVWLALCMLSTDKQGVKAAAAVIMVLVDSLFVGWCVVHIVLLAHSTIRPVRAVVDWIGGRGKHRAPRV